MNGAIEAGGRPLSSFALGVVTPSQQRTGLVLLTLAGVVAIGFTMAQSGVSPRPVLLGGIAAVLLVPLLARAVNGTFDILEPITATNVALFAMFVIRPIALLAYDQLDYGSEMRFNLSTTFDEALLVVLVGVAALNVGYATHFGRMIGAKAPPLASKLHHDTAVAAAIGLIGLGMVAYAVYALQQGHNPLSIIVGGGIRSGGNETTAYLYSAPFMIIPAALIFIHVGQSSKTIVPRLIAIVLAAVVAHSLAPAGQRLWLLLLLGSFAVYPMLRTGWRPSLGLLLLALIPAFFIVVAMRDLRYNDPGQFIASLSASISDPGSSAEELLLGPDLEMFSGIAAQLQLTPEEVPYKPGNTLSTLVTKPVPRVFYPDKPRPLRETLNSVMRPRAFRFGGQGIEFSPIGLFYGDSAYAGVIAGMFTIGVGLRALFEYLRANRQNDLVRLFFAAALPLFTVVLMRGHLDDTLGRAFFLLVPLIAVSILANKAEAGVRRSQAVSGVQ